MSGGAFCYALQAGTHDEIVMHMYMGDMYCRHPVTHLIAAMLGQNL